MKTMTTCKETATVLADLLFDPAAAPASARIHLENCLDCQAELRAMQGTMQLLDSWEAPEPSPFWNARMGARLREEAAAPQRGWVGFRERMRTRFWLSNHALRPVTAGVAAAALLIAAGGGAWLDFSTSSAPPAVQASNTVRDLQSLNENAQVFQQMASLEGVDTNGSNTTD